MSKQRTVRLEVSNPDGTVQTFDLAVGKTATVVQPIEAHHDRFDLRGETRVVIRRVT